MVVCGLSRVALLLVLALLLASLSVASAAIPIPGKLMVSGSDGVNPVVYFMEGTTSNTTPAPVGFYSGDISPDGAQVAYIVGVTATSLNIWKSGIDGSGQVNLTQTSGVGGVNCAPRWSPDGSQIAFAHADPATGQKPCDAGIHVYVMNSDGTGAHRVTAPGTSPTRVPVWTPDGSRLLCEADWLGTITINTDGTDIVVLPNVAGCPAISPDGSRIASSQSEYSGTAKGTYRRLLLTNADGSNPTTLVERFISDADVVAHLIHVGLPTDDFNIGVVPWNVGPVVPEWSPTGGMIVYSAATQLDVQGLNFDLQREVWVYDLATSTATQVTSNSWCDADFSWHGDNTYPDHASVTVDPVTVTFSQVTAEGLTTIIRDDTAPAPPEGHWAVGSAYRIETTAATAGPTTVRVTYPEGVVSSGAESHLALLRYNEGAAQWEDITASRDTAGNAVTGQPTSLGLITLSLPLPTGHFSDVPSSPVDAHWALWEIEAAYAAGVVQGYSDGTYQPSSPVTRDQMAVYISRSLVIPGGDAAIPDPVPPATFSDVASTHWAYKHIEYAVSQNVVKGYSDGTYKPDLVVDRGQMAVFVARAMVTPGGDAGIPDPVPPPTFPDVLSDFWAYKQVEYCVGHGVVKGYDDGTYRPGDPVTRDQMAVYVARAFKLQV